MADAHRLGRKVALKFLPPGLANHPLALARFEREPASGSVTCDLAEVARDVAAQLERLAEIREVAVTVHAPDSVTVALEGAPALLCWPIFC